MFALSTRRKRSNDTKKNNKRTRSLPTSQLGGFNFIQKRFRKNYNPHHDLLHNLMAEKKKIFLFKEKCAHNGIHENDDNIDSTKKFDSNGILEKVTTKNKSVSSNR